LRTIRSKTPNQLYKYCDLLECRELSDSFSEFFLVPELFGCLELPDFHVCEPR
jgi:hypothetical protein